jgi:hypothetical protein
VLYALGERGPARGSFRRAAELKTDFTEALNALGHMSARDGEPGEAIDFYKRALAARPDYGSAHNNLAVAYYRKGEYAHAYKHMAKAEAAGYAVPPSFKRAVIREDERRAFLEFQREFARARSRSARVFSTQSDGLQDSEKPAALSELERREVVLAALRLRFRDSGGGVSLGERRVRGKTVAHYREAARVELDLGDGRRRELLVIARESASRSSLLPRTIAGGRKELVTWVAEAGFRFSAEAPELVQLVSRIVWLEVEGSREAASSGQRHGPDQAASSAQRRRPDRAARGP